MRARLLPALIASTMAAASAAVAQETGFKLEGSVGAGGIASTGHPLDAAKLNEYRDLDDGFFGLLELHGRGERDYLDFYTENIGRTDFYLNLRGGRYGIYKYQLYGDYLRHNIGFGPYGGRTPFTGAGSANETATFPALNSNVPPWHSFDYSFKRNLLGGNFEFSGGTPWYGRVDYNEVKTGGIKVGSGAQGTSPGNGFIDLQLPADYRTRNLAVEGGYQTPKGAFAISYVQSKFYNENSALMWTNGFFANGTDRTSLAPDSDYWRVGANGVLRDLPLRSSLAARVTYSKLTNNVPVQTTALDTGGTNPSTAPSTTTFGGDIANTTVGVTWSALLARGLDSRVYYNYIDYDNNSTVVTFSPAAATGLECGITPTGICVSGGYSYTKQNPGLELRWRINPGNRLSGGYDYLHVKRTRGDSEETTDNKLYVQWTNTSLEQVTARVKYQYLMRRSPFLLGNVGTGPNDPIYLERFVRRFDVADNNQNLLKFFVDWSPMRFLDVAFEAYLKSNDYTDTTLGRTKDNRQELYASVTYGDPSAFRVTFFGDIEWIKYDSYHRTINNGTCNAATGPNCFSPFSPATTGAFNWSGTNRDRNWMLGAGADWPAMTNLLVKASLLYGRTDGSADFAAQPLANGSPAANLFPINAYDDTRYTSLSLRGVYSVGKNWEFTGGYAYERYDYEDIQYQGYQYTIGTGAGASYLSGAYAFPDYSTSIWFGMARYKF